MGDKVQPGGGEDLKGFKSLFMRLRRMGGSCKVDDIGGSFFLKALKVFGRILLLFIGSIQVVVALLVCYTIFLRQVVKIETRLKLLKSRKIS